MRKLLIFITFILIVVGILFFINGKDFLLFLDEKKVYKIENIERLEIDSLEEVEFFNKGIVTYNNQNIVHMDLNNEIIWKRESNEFSNEIFVREDYIYKQSKGIEVLDRNNQQFLIPDIKGNLINVSRENGKTAFLVVESGQTLFITDENNNVAVSKEFIDPITGISFSDKSEAYAVITLRFENNSPINTLYFNLIDNVELWSGEIKNEVLINVQVVNNQVIALGTENIYFYNNNGKLMWRNRIYNKIVDYYISRENQRINLIFDKDSNKELISYNFEGKIMEIQSLPTEVLGLKIYDSRIYLYSNNSLYLVHGGKFDKIFDSGEKINDFIVKGNNIYILFKNKLVKGQIK